MFIGWLSRQPKKMGGEPLPLRMDVLKNMENMSNTCEASKMMFMSF